MTAERSSLLVDATQRKNVPNEFNNLIVRFPQGLTNFKDGFFKRLCITYSLRTEKKIILLCEN